jgi:hypothetical protein
MMNYEKVYKLMLFSLYYNKIKKTDNSKSLIILLWDTNSSGIDGLIQC